MAKHSFERLKTCWNPFKEGKLTEIVANQKAYIIVSKSNPTNFLKHIMSWDNDFGSSGKKYRACYYLQKGSAILEAQKLNDVFGDDDLVVKEMTMIEDQIVLKTLD